MARWRPVAAGVGAGAAISVPAALVAQVLEAVLDDGLPAAGAVVLAVLAASGALVGPVVAARAGAGRGTCLLAGAVLLTLVAGLGVGRRAAAGDALRAEVLPAAVAVGAALGAAGGAIGSTRRRRGAARTRP